MEFKPHFYRHRGITILQKRDPSLTRLHKSKIAVVLAGGAVSGGAFKVGGLRALDEMFASRKVPGDGVVPFRLVDCDLFVGLSAGSVLASVLAAGITPDEILRIILGTSTSHETFGLTDFIGLDLGEMVWRMRSMLEHQQELVTNYLSGATDPDTIAPFAFKDTLLKLVASLPRGLPMGLFSTERLGRYLQRNMTQTGLTDDFGDMWRRTGKELMLTAVDINRGELLTFGHDEPYAGVPISQAIRASCALPGWYQPVRIANPRADEDGEPPFFDLVDGGLMRTANVRIAVEKGADLVLCYNPFNRIRYERDGRSLVDHGPWALASQLFRILLGARLDLAKEALFRDPSIDADVVFIEPAEDDYIFFRMNPLRHSNQGAAAAHGYRTIRAGILANHRRLEEIFATHGIRLHASGAGSHELPWSGTEVSSHDLRESRGVRR